MFQAATAQGHQRLWRMDTHGRGLVDLPDAAWSGVEPSALSPDGAMLYYTRTDGRHLWRRPLAGGKAELLGEIWILFSPDGTRYLRVQYPTPGETGPRQYEIRSADDDRVLQTLAIDPVFLVSHWTPSGEALLAQRVIDGARNLWRVPLDGGPPVQLTHYGPGYAGHLQLSGDGRWLLVSRSERLPGEVVRIRNFR